jgi:hypothetical protein
MKIISYTGFIIFILIILSGYSSYEIYKYENQKKSLKEDKVILASVKYGIFNAEEWQRILTNILKKKIDEIELGDIYNEDLTNQIEDYLENTIDTIEQDFKASIPYYIPPTLVESLSAGFFESLHERVPYLTDQIFAFLEDEEAKEYVKAYIIELLDDYAMETISEEEDSTLSKLYHIYNTRNKDELAEAIEEELQLVEKHGKPFKIILAISCILLLILLFLSNKLTRVDYLVLFIFSIPYLLLGVSLPMLEIDARLASVSFYMLGEPITFENQILYYNSKSILQVFRILFDHPDFWIKVTGVLVILFSVFFPVLKLIASIAFLFFEKNRSNRFLQAFVFKIGKWSMADVFVVAIFMSFLGFQGILSDQMGSIEGLSEEINMITTHESNLLFAFYSFLAFVVISVLASSKLHNGIYRKDNESR